MTPDLLIRLIADLAVIPVVLVGTYIMLFKVPKGQRFQVYSRVMMAGLTAYLLAKLVGSIYQPQELRPFEVLGIAPSASYLDNPGFPSDHMLFVSALTLAVWFETKLKKIALVLAGLSILIGVGRVLALVHTPLDVIGGLAFALIGALWYVQNWVEKRGEYGKDRHHRIQHR
jgi:membrane-associated phospholipid phosphatase